MQGDQMFWDERHISGNTGWDMQQVSPPLAAYIDGLQDKGLSILIPGCGNAYEAQYLLQRGFRNITLLDISPFLVSRLQKKFSGTNIRIIQEDFFNHQGDYDIVLEQTFFCAILPNQRKAYVRHASELLQSGGKIAGVLFNNFGYEDHPPFWGSEAQYRQLFSPFFDILIMEPCRNSIEPRVGNELFFELRKKN